MEEFIAVGDITDGIAAGLRGRAPSKEIPVHLELPEDSEDDVADGVGTDASCTREAEDGDGEIVKTVDVTNGIASEEWEAGEARHPKPE